MEKKLSELYQQIAETVVDMIPEKWEHVIFYGEASEEHRKMVFYYFSIPQNKLIYCSQIWDDMGFDKQTYDILWDRSVKYLKQLRQTFIDHGQEPWTNLTMRFDSNGKFSIEYHYDDFTDIDAYTRLLLWEHMIAQVPLQDSYEIKTTNEYIDYLQKRNWLYNNRPVQRIEQYRITE